MYRRTHCRLKAVLSNLRQHDLPQTYHTTAAATMSLETYVPAPSHEQITLNSVSTARFPTTQPPSYKPPEFRKSQLIRSYASLLRSTPLILLFQHNSLKSSEWIGVRRELAVALRKVDDAIIASGHTSECLAVSIKLQTIQTGLFATALRIVEFYRPGDQGRLAAQAVTDKGNLSDHGSNASDFTHTLSNAAHAAIKASDVVHDLDPLLSGPLVLLSFPSVSPQYLKTALSVLSPSPPNFPAPTKRAHPGLHDPTVQSGIQKLLLLGARVDGKVFDNEGTRWIGGIEGGLEGLRSQLVQMLQSFGNGVTNTLGGASKSLFVTVEGRRIMLGDETQPRNEGGK